MLTLMLTKERLETVLRNFPGGVANVSLVSLPRWVATVVSASFEGQDEAERQAAVWAYLDTHFSDAELQQIEFIFTNTPAERAAS